MLIDFCEKLARVFGKVFCNLKIERVNDGKRKIFKIVNYNYCMVESNRVTELGIERLKK